MWCNDDKAYHAVGAVVYRACACRDLGSRTMIERIAGCWV